MNLLNKNKVAKEINEKEIDNGELLNKEGYHPKHNKDLGEGFKKYLIRNNMKKQGSKKAARALGIKLVAIDIGTSTTKIVEGKCKGGKLQVHNMYKVPTKENALRDGILEETNVLSMYMQGALKEKKLKTKNVAFVSTSSTIISRELILPYVDNEEEFRNLVKYEIQQFLFINLNNYEVQYMKIEDIVDNDGAEKQKILAIIYPKEMIQKYKELGDKMGLTPYALDITNNCVRKVANGASFFNSDLINQEGINMFLDFGASTINISIVNKGKLDFVRVLPSGGNEINEAIIELKEVSREEAEQLKVEHIDLEKNKDDSINEAAIRVVDDWIDNINRIIQFYASKTSGKNIGHIYLYGGSSKLKGFAEHFEGRIGISTSSILTVDNIEFAANCKVATVEEYINALGALIRL